MPENLLVGGHDEHNRAIYTQQRADGGTDVVRIGIEDPAFNSTMTVPAGYLNLRFAGAWVVVTVDKGDGTYEMRVARGGAQSADPVVRLPAGATTDARPVVLGAQGSEVLIGYRLADGSPGYGILTAYDGRVKPLPVTGDASSFRLTQMTVSWFSRNGSGGQGVRVMPRSGTGTPQVIPLATQSPDSEVTSFVVDDNIVWHEGPAARCGSRPSPARTPSARSCPRSSSPSSGPRATGTCWRSARTPTASGPSTCSTRTASGSSPTW